ncbi:Na+/H+ antiporter subunit E [Neorhizobium sp. SOG26]|jgi:Multisubunit Na+/H+ antiporter, MnhE subunit|uniref:Na+/H+ antiporter subunit E n=1 Tax=Neorhizobium sp. SOG26 TaxID=2060726 RepID=UPI000E56887B|nr:Na+/H+ antiporter subunit E [Neorhizobium sp. SOG26]AXV16079.1 Na+/H+ antiporter subunit E [Neorhizobium sp. SOG26]
MFPYPILTTFLVLMWLLLNGFTLGHLLLGIIVAVIASWAMASLRPEKPKLKKWYLLPKLLFIVLYDIVRSNIAVALLILRGRKQGHTTGFINLPLELEDSMALAILSIIITSTPGSAWLEYDSHDKSVLLHVLDVIDENQWIETVKERYEKLLLEIFA